MIPPVLRVTWFESHRTGRPRGTTAQPALLEGVGFLVAESEATLVLCSALDPDATLGGGRLDDTLLVISKQAIADRIVLAPAVNDKEPPR